MEIKIQRNIHVPSPKTRTLVADAFYLESKEKLPLVVFIHGYKGYKDWGAWNLVAKSFAEAGFYFVKFNFSHNGMSLDNQTDFDDLEAFAENNYSKEMADVKAILAYFTQQPEVDASELNLIGHSRGGGIAIIEAFENESIHHLITWAGVETLDRFPKNDAFKEWKESGVYSVVNGRTGQKMPHYFQWYKDFSENRSRFDVESSFEQLKALPLIIHGTNDEAVSVQAAHNLDQWNPKSELFLIENANHTFGAKEPWEENFLPEHLKIAVQKSIEFLKS